MVNANKNEQFLRHSAAHLLGHAVSELFPDTLLTIGPATEEGFFYDFLPTRNFKEEDIPLIEERMAQLVKKNLPLTHTTISKEEARVLFKHNPFKLELIEEIPDEFVGIARQGDFIDLCKGGHVASTGLLKHFKLMGISGSYWRARRDGQALQRISGVVFYSQEELEKYFVDREAALLNEHRRIGKQLDYFSFHDEGVGFPFFHPKGMKIFTTLVEYMRKLHNKFDYHEVMTPTMLSQELWRQSGHYDHYKQNMYFTTVDEKTYAVKPMNCPGAILIYKSRPRSYRELPLKFAEFGHVHRHELSGVLHGLMRARAFTQDDAHIFCNPEHFEKEIVTILQIALQMLQKCGFELPRFAVATRPENSMGSHSLWEKATQALMSSLKQLGVEYAIKEGEGAFYGPKIEIHIEDSLGRSWQCGTVQVDFFLAQNFNLTYVNSSGEKECPVIIHQALYGSLERFIGILLEHHKGNLPFWLSPIQIKILPLSDEQRSYAASIYQELKTRGLRTEIDNSGDPLSGQIKSAQLEKIPMMIIIGKKEAEQNKISLRTRDGKQELNITIESLLEKIEQIA
jgi:threonyl-tRNA synthetase